MQLSTALQMNKKSEGYHRCRYCDYCALSDGDDGRAFNYDNKEDCYICSICTQEIGEALQEFGYDEYEEDLDSVGNSWRTSKNKPITEWISDREKKGPPKKVTLPGVKGVNDGPRINLDKEDKS